MRRRHPRENGQSRYIGLIDSSVSVSKVISMVVIAIEQSAVANAISPGVDFPLLCSPFLLSRYLWLFPSPFSPLTILSPISYHPYSISVFSVSPLPCVSHVFGHVSVYHWRSRTAPADDIISPSEVRTYNSSPSSVDTEGRVGWGLWD